MESSAPVVAGIKIGGATHLPSQAIEHRQASGGNAALQQHRAGLRAGCHAAESRLIQVEWQSVLQRILHRELQAAGILRTAWESHQQSVARAPALALHRRQAADTAQPVERIHRTGRIAQRSKAVARSRATRADGIIQVVIILPANVKELLAAGLGKGDIASKVKVPPFAAGKLITQAKAFTREQILSYVELCVESEEAVKTGRMADRMAVELLIARKY